MDIYKLYRDFWDYSFNNPEQIKPTHVAIYSFAIEHCNRLGWKPKFGFPTSMAMEATGIKSYSVFKKHFDDLVRYGFINLITPSKNQYSSNVIALKENYKAHDKALDKALIKHTSKQVQSTHQSTIQSIDQSIDSINKQVYNIQVYKEQDIGDKSPNQPIVKKTIEERESEFKERVTPFIPKYGQTTIDDFLRYWTEKNANGTKMLFEMNRTFEISKRLVTWKKNEPLFNKKSTQKLTEDGEPIDQVEKFKLRAQQQLNANR
jgi:hypothetical protein